MRIISIYSSLHFNQYCLSYMSCFLYSLISFLSFFFFFNDPPTPEIYPLSLHDALPISRGGTGLCFARLHKDIRVARQQETVLSYIAAGEKEGARLVAGGKPAKVNGKGYYIERSEEHTSELQSRLHLVCRLLLEKKKKHN